MLSDYDGQKALKLALALVEKYAPGGKATAAAVEAGLKRDLEQIPAEIVTDQAVRLLKADKLFLIGRELEMASYNIGLSPFDQLSVETKSMLGSLLDYASVNRERFARAWKSSEDSSRSGETGRASLKNDTPRTPLFDSES